MKSTLFKTTLIIVCILTTNYNRLFSQTKADTSTSKIEIRYNKNVELLGLAYFLGYEGAGIENKTVEIGGKTIPKKEWHNYGYSIYEKYKSFATSENLGQSFALADHLWLDYIISFLLQVGDVPNAKLTDSIEEKYYLNFSKEKNSAEAKKNALLFLEGFNLFSEEIDFDLYLSNSEKYYKKMLEEVESELPNKAFIGVMESFYQNKFDHYVLIPSLTIPKGMGYGIIHIKENETTIYNVFGGFDFQEFDTNDALIMGFANSKRLRELSVHEFGHSFVNPVLAQLPDSLFTETEKLFEPLKSAMSDQGYLTWKTCLNEHFVRAGEIMIARNLGDFDDASDLEKDYIENRKFIYIPLILESLEVYNKSDKMKYKDAVIEAMEKIKLEH